jgi:EAL domain-containing protein (putative c-di-GMP-specific phosphodiesterase class I)
VHGEPFTVLARADAGVTEFAELKGKRVNVGNPGSGQRATIDDVLNALGWYLIHFGQTSELQPTEQAAALGDNKVDAIVYTVGHPNGSIQEATSTVESKLVNLTGPEIDSLIADNPYYAKATIPGGMYANNDEDTTTFGVKATFVTSADVDEDVVYTVVKAVFDNFDRFKGLHPAFATLTLSVNVSSKQFHQVDFVDKVRYILSRYTFNLSCLKLELTESLLVQNIEQVVENMRQLSDLGIKISLDDFGTGYSSLSYLQKLPLQQVKIDQSFVRNLLDPIQSDEPIVKTIISLGQAYGFNIIAEGVETKAQLNHLASLGCHSYQGYYFSKPLSIDGFEDYMV